MAPRKAVALVPEQEPEPIPEYKLEQLDDSTRSILNVWGNSTQLTIQQLEAKAPGWSTMLNDIFTVVGLSISEH
jgi:hypothetical protein